MFLSPLTERLYRLSFIVILLRDDMLLIEILHEN